jgi:NAD-dependent SIR2 family protein deacetylase
MNSDSEKKKVLLIFGAGASCDAGAPTQEKIFQYYFKKYDNIREHEKLREFFQKIFGLKELSYLNKYSTFPTFEEVLGILEFAVQNGTSLGKDFPIDEIRNLKELVINLMAETIKKSLENPNNDNHKILINKLFENNEFEYSFINLNYDILLDKALIDLYGKYDLDYGIEFWRNYLDGSWSEPRDSKVYLLKPHGSLNWFYCPSCNSIYLNVKGKPDFKETEIEPVIPKCKYCNLNSE